MVKKKPNVEIIIQENTNVLNLSFSNNAEQHNPAMLYAPILSVVRSIFISVSLNSSKSKI